MLTKLFYVFSKEESGQGITEYGAVLAFVAFLMAATLTAGQGTLGLAVKNAFSATGNVLTQIANNAS
jgi:Flp pilus assembly pilin Flp